MKHYLRYVLGLICGVASAPVTMAQDEDVKVYCGYVSTSPDDLQPDAPFIDSITMTFAKGQDVGSVTNQSQVQNVLAKTGRHTVLAVYADSQGARKIAGEVSAYFQSHHSATTVCIKGRTTTKSPWGTPLEIQPIAVTAPLVAKPR